MNAHTLLFRILPKNILSYSLGKLVRVQLPSPFANTVNSLFVRAFKINMSEAEKPIKDYRTLEELFTRKLRNETRAWQGPLCSPCDGFVSNSVPLDPNRPIAVQAKGFEYSVNELLFNGEKPSPTFSPSWAMTIYLAPHNYHRVHTPCAGKLRSVSYYPGELWPVNQTFTHLIPNLFSRNERLVFELEYAGGGTVYAVMVGAFNVGRIIPTDCPTLVTNDRVRLRRRPSPRHVELQPSVKKSLGDELGVFALGSTVVLIFDRIMAERFAFLQATDPIVIAAGNPIIEQRK